MDLVWAKMRGFPYWPGKICTPKRNPENDEKLSRGQRWIFFFETKDYGWVEEINMKPYVEHRASMVEKIKKQKQKKKLNEAVKRIDEYLSDPRKYKANACEDKPKAPSTVPRNMKSESAKTAKRPPNGDYSGTPPKKARLDRESKVGSTSIVENVPSPRPNPAASLTHRPPADEPPQIVVQKLEGIVASKKTIGFIGYGTTDSGIVKNLLNSGHKVIICYRDPSQSKKLEDIRAEVGLTPCEVAQKADIIFCCVSDPEESTEIFFGSGGILSSTQHLGGKDYVEMTGLDVTTSQRIAQAIESEGGRYLEAPILESRVQAEEDGTLIILSAGERTLFDECQSCFNAIGKTSIYLGDVGNASNMRLVIQMVIANVITALAEPLSLAERVGLPLKDVLEVMGLTPLSSLFINEKGKAIIGQNFAAHQPLKRMQKDIQLGLQLSEQYNHAMPITAATNQVFIRAKGNGYSEQDISAVYKVLSIPQRGQQGEEDQEGQ